MDRDHAARGFAAMGSPARLAVLRALVRAGEEGLSIGQIQARTEIAASTLAHHLRSLQTGGLITQTRNGRQTLNHAEYDHLRRLAAYILDECCADTCESDAA